MRISDWSSDVCSSDLSKIRRFWRRAFAGTTSLAFLISIARSRKFVLQSQHLLMIHFYERSNLLKINVPDRSHDHGVKGMNCLMRTPIFRPYIYVAAHPIRTFNPQCRSEERRVRKKQFSRL